MKRMGVTEWRSKLGELRQGTDVIVVLYRQRPAALLVPAPPAYWSDITPFLQKVLAIRDRQLQPPTCEAEHEWLQQGTHSPTSINFEEARRGTAMLFGHIVRNTPVILTFYDYANAIVLPVPPDLSDEALETIHQEVQEYARAPEAQ